MQHQMYVFHLLLYVKSFISKNSYKYCLNTQSPVLSVISIFIISKIVIIKVIISIVVVYIIVGSVYQNYKTAQLIKSVDKVTLKSLLTLYPRSTLKFSNCKFHFLNILTIQKLYFTNYIVHVTSCIVQVTSYIVQFTSLIVQVTSYIVQFTSYIVQFTSLIVQVTSYIVQVTSYILQVTSYIPQVTTYITN